MASAFCFMGFISWSAHATDAELTIPSAVEVSPRSEVTIYDIVEAKNMSSDVADDLKEIVIDANAMNKADLARALRSVKARFVLPKELKIIRSRGSISRMEVERKVKNKIYSDCARCEVQVQISSVPANVQGDWDMDLNIDLSKSNVMIPVYSTKNTDNKGWIIADIRRYQKVPVLTRSIKLGDILTEDMFTMETRQLTQSRDTVQSIQAVAGMQAVRKNRYIITQKDFEKAYKKVVRKPSAEFNFYQ